MNDYKYKKIAYIIIFLGVIIRIIGINKFPAGLNCDEASTAYDAYSILTTLKDRNDLLLPVYPLAWGLGQSALLMYLMIPFIKMLGLNIISIRLPMAIFSSISLIVFHNLLKMTFDKKEDKNTFYIIFGLLFFALNPWHIMKSRWGLDCNLFPDILFFGIYFLIKYFRSAEKKNSELILAFALFSISAYSYASAYLALTILCILIFIYGLRNGVLTVRQILVVVAVVFFITWPLITMVAINFFDLNSIRLPFMTIPKLNANRMVSNTILSNSSFLTAIFKNVISSLKLYIFQYDTYYWNGLKGIGMYYLYSFPLLVVGIISYFREVKYLKSQSKNVSKNVSDDIFFIWLIVGFISNLFHTEININRANVIIIPIIYFIVKGFCLLFSIKIMKMISVILLLISFTYFSYVYVDGNIKKENGVLVEGINTTFADCFEIGLEPVINYANDLNAEEITFYSHLSETTAYIYVLYYLKFDSKLYYSTHKLYDDSKGYMKVKSFGNWRFDRPSSLAMDKKYVYIFEKEILPIVDTEHFNVQEINDYIVVQYKGKSE